MVLYLLGRMLWWVVLVWLCVLGEWCKEVVEFGFVGGIVCKVECVGGV